MFDPVKSAEPPISKGKSLVIFFKIFSEDFLVANGFNSLAAVSFALFIIDLIFFLIVSSFKENLFDFFSSALPFFPISLQAFKICSGTSNGSYDHFNFFLINLISSSPIGLPCAEDLPALFGEPNPILVLHEITVGFFAFCAFLSALKISFSL